MRKIEKINALAREMCDRTVPCDECNFNVKGPYCMARIYAKKVINMGYSKVGEDEQVVKKDQLNEALNAAQESGQRMGYAKGRDETAREILQDLNNRYNECGGAVDVAIMLYDWLSEMGKKYGIELED